MVDTQKRNAVAEIISSPGSASVGEASEKKPLKHPVREIIWDSLDRSPEERRLIFKLDIFIL